MTSDTRGKRRRVAAALAMLALVATASWPFVDYLARRGLRAFAIDLRCFGFSACPEGEAKGRVVDDITSFAFGVVVAGPMAMLVAPSAQRLVGCLTGGPRR